MQRKTFVKMKFSVKTNAAKTDKTKPNKRLEIVEIKLLLFLTGALVFVGHFTDGHFFFVGVAVGTLHVGMREGLGKTQVMLSYV
jgi:hypothetical protein